MKIKHIFFILLSINWIGLQANEQELTPHLNESTQKTHIGKIQNSIPTDVKMHDILVTSDTKESNESLKGGIVFSDLIHDSTVSLEVASNIDKSSISNIARSLGILYSVNIIIGQSIVVNDEGGSNKLHVENYKLLSKLFNNVLLNSSFIFAGVNPEFSQSMNDLSQEFIKVSIHESDSFFWSSRVKDYRVRFVDIQNKIKTIIKKLQEDM
ncbi:hypothetical protein MJH12_00690 [bacterium]|nr:hypothetical protein [bacterium]